MAVTKLKDTHYDYTFRGCKGYIKQRATNSVELVQKNASYSGSISVKVHVGSLQIPFKLSQAGIKHLRKHKYKVVVASGFGLAGLSSLRNSIDTNISHKPKINIG